MKALTYSRYGGSEVLEWSERAPPLPEPQQVRIRVMASSINAADYRIMRAEPGFIRLINGLKRPKKWPVLGSDVAGIVEAVGAEVKRFNVGDAVFGNAFEDGMGTFAELVCVREWMLAKKPEQISFEEAAAVPLAALTALQGLRQVSVGSGDAVMIQGAGGGVGGFAVQLAALQEADVTATCGAGNVERIKALGANRVLDYKETDYAREGHRYDVIVGINGRQPLGAYKRCLKPDGRLLIIGGSTRQFFEIAFFGRLRFAFSGKQQGLLTLDHTKTIDDLQHLRQLLEDGKLDSCIDRTFPFDDLPRAMEYVEEGHVRGKVVISHHGVD